MDPIPYADLQNLSEDARINLIGTAVVTHGKVVGVLLDHDSEKVARYRQKLTARFPGLVIETQVDFTKNAILLRVGPAKHND